MSVAAAPGDASPPLAAERPQIPDVDAPTRRVSGVAWAVVLVLAAAGIAVAVNQIFGLKLFGFEPVSNAYEYILIGLFLPIAYLAYPAHAGGKDRVPWYDWPLAFLSLAIPLYLSTQAEAMISQGWDIVAPPMETALAGVFCVLVLEGLRRGGGTALFIIALVLGCYPLYAGHMPGFLWGNEYDLAGMLRAHVFGVESIIGVPMQVVSEVLIGFIIFGVVLGNTGGGVFFMDLASALAGRSRGGPAKVCILSSGFFGMLSGSPTSDVIATGTLTIPTMKRFGYPATYAAAIEACASTGGALMPPVMGTAAFIMASFLNVTYAAVAAAAFLPAVLYYAALLFQSDLFAAKNALAGLSQGEVPPLAKTLKDGWPYLFSLALLIYLLLGLRLEAYAPFYAILALLAAALLRRRDRFGLRQFADLLVRAGQSVGQLVALLAGIGFIVGAMSLTGVGNSFSRELVQYAHGSIPLLLFFGAITSFILGMGMTVSACYIFLAIVLAPALVTAGIDPMASHLYILYWGILSFITPPVALAAITAASIAKANAMRTGYRAMRLGAVLFLLPVLFALDPALLLNGTWAASGYVFVKGMIAVALMGAASEAWFYGLGHLGPARRVVIGLAGFVLLLPGWQTDLAGVILALALYAHALATRRRVAAT